MDVDLELRRSAARMAVSGASVPIRELLTKVQSRSACTELEAWDAYNRARRGGCFSETFDNRSNTLYVRAAVAREPDEDQQRLF